VPYNEYFKNEVRRVFAKKEIDFQHLTLLNVLVAEQHAVIVNQCLDQWGVDRTEVDLLASHGQTVFHAPRVLHGLSDYPNATLQIGDGDHLARRTGLITLSDFRQKHVAAGGEGAPLALYGDYFLFSKKGEERFLLNIGGIANFTYLPANGNMQAALATDTGPGNTLLDTFARNWYGQPFDEDARLAQAGHIDESLLARLKSEPFFGKPFPKTIGPELFSMEWVLAALGNPARIDDARKAGVMATLTRLTADTIVEAILRLQASHTPAAPRLYLSGGGAHNPLIVQHIRRGLHGWKIRPMQALGIDGDAKEAVLFAILANETVAGQAESATFSGGIPLVGMGKISLPG
jgi:anhydro-N-acetylmuramic acid kinase